jgi:hypothetical protein
VIGEYLGVTPRTAQLWERDRGLPVHRLPGPKGRVIATAEELDAWRFTARNASLDEPSHGFVSFRRVILAGLSVLALICVIALALWPRPAPAGFRVDGLTLVALDQGGKDLWRYAIPNQYHYALHRTSQQPRIELADLDGDGRSEALLSVEADEPGPERNSLLIALASSGKEMWRLSPGREVRSPVDEFPLPYRIPDFAVLRAGDRGKPKIVVSSNHITLYANQVSLLDARTGRMEREYWHSGALQRLIVHDANGDGRPEIYAAGIHNASKQAVLVVLDPETLSGASVEGNPNYQIAGFGPGREVARVYFPASCHTRKLGQYNVAGGLKPEAGGVEVVVWDPIPGQQHVNHHYRLNADLSLRNMVEGDNYMGIHNGLHYSGFLDHELGGSEREAKKAIVVVGPGQTAPARP